MADQNVVNVLNGNLEILDQIVSDLNDHKEKKEELDKLNSTLKELAKDIDGAIKSVNDEIDDKVKSGISSVSKGFDQSISEEKAKLKDVQGKREKAKHAGVKERIQNETAQLKDENADLSTQIRTAFKEERIPKYCSRRFFYAMVRTQGIGDAFIYVLTLLVLYAAVPCVLYMIPQVPDWVLIAYYFVVAVIMITAIKIVYDKTVLPHSETIAKARNVKREIVANQKKMKRIEKAIRKDKNEDMYGLTDYDFRINEINDNIRNIEADKERAIAQFNESTKKDIIAEVHGRTDDNINSMKAQLADGEKSRDELDALIKGQRAFILSNYEAYLGKEFTNIDKLVELSDIMREDPSLTISAAIVKYKSAD